MACIWILTLPLTSEFGWITESLRTSVFSSEKWGLPPPACENFIRRCAQRDSPACCWCSQSAVSVFPVFQLWRVTGSLEKWNQLVSARSSHPTEFNFIKSPSECVMLGVQVKELRAFSLQNNQTRDYVKIAGQVEALSRHSICGAVAVRSPVARILSPGGEKGHYQSASQPNGKRDPAVCRCCTEALDMIFEKGNVCL